MRLARLERQPGADSAQPATNSGDPRAPYSPSGTRNVPASASRTSSDAGTTRSQFQTVRRELRLCDGLAIAFSRLTYTWTATRHGTMRRPSHEKTPGRFHNTFETKHPIARRPAGSAPPTFAGVSSDVRELRSKR